MRFVPLLFIALVASQGFADVTGFTIYKSEFYEHDHKPTVTQVTPDGKVKKTNAKVGEATQVAVSATFNKEIEDGEAYAQVTFPTFASDAGNGGYAWGKTIESVRVTIRMGNGEHKYFWFNDGGKSLQLEYPAPGVSPYSDYLLKTVLRGNNHDMSRAVNGHMPSKIPQQQLFSKDSLWMQSSSWGKETYRTIDMPELLPKFDTATAIISFMDARFRNADKMDLKQISKTINTQEVLQHVEGLLEWALTVDLLETPIYRASVEIEAELKE